MIKQRSNHHHWHGKVVVVTGASAGVGRATALAFANAGAKVALLGRDPKGLEDTRAHIVWRGGSALAIPTDVADPEAVFAAAQTCEDTLGPIAVWVNNAMVTAFSPVSDLTPDEIRRVTEVTYLGTVHGTLAALSKMRPRNEGTIVQVGSGLAYRPIPLQSAYCGAKHAIRGFTDALRSELLHEHSGIQVTMVQLPAVNTPQFDWARTHMPNQPRPVAPVYRPEAAGRAIVQAARYPVREYFLGYQTPLMIMGQALMPGLLDRYLARNAYQGQDRGVPVEADRKDNLMEPVPGKHAMRGAFARETQAHALLIPGSVARAAGLTLLLGIGALLGGCLGRRR